MAPTDNQGDQLKPSQIIPQGNLPSSSLRSVLGRVDGKSLRIPRKRFQPVAAGQETLVPSGSSCEGDEESAVQIPQLTKATEGVEIKGDQERPTEGSLQPHEDGSIIPNIVPANGPPGTPTIPISALFLDALKGADKRRKKQVEAKFRKFILDRITNHVEKEPSVMKRLQSNPQFFASVLDSISWGQDAVIDSIALIPLSCLNSDDMIRLGVAVSCKPLGTIVRNIEEARLPQHFGYPSFEGPDLAPLQPRLSSVMESYISPSEKSSQAVIDVYLNEIFVYNNETHYFAVNKEVWLSKLSGKSSPVCVKHRAIENNKTTSYTTFLTGILDYAVITSQPQITQKLDGRFKSFRDRIGRSCHAYKGQSYAQFETMLDSVHDRISIQLRTIQLKREVFFIESKRRAMHGEDSTSGNTQQDMAFVLDGCFIDDGLGGRSESEDEVRRMLLDQLSEMEDSNSLAGDSSGSAAATTARPVKPRMKQKPSPETRKKTFTAVIRGSDKAKPHLSDHLAQAVGQCLAAHASLEKEYGVYKFALSTGNSWLFGVVECMETACTCYHTDVTTIICKQLMTFKDPTFMLMTWMVVPAPTLLEIFTKTPS